MLTWSLNEVEANTRKAARGMGLPWGLAEEAGRAARYLSERGLPGALCLANVLQRIDPATYHEMTPISEDELVARGDLPLCPIVTGTVLSDGDLGQQALDIGPMLAPALLLPFVAALHRPVTLCWAGVTVGVDGPGLWIAGQTHDLMCDGCDGVQIGAGLPDAPAWHGGAREQVSQGTAAVLLSLAERTYAPATAQSRQAGAGGAED